MSGDMQGRTVVVTGANAGIGRATAEGLAARGARVLACGRNPSKLDAAVDAIRRATGNDAVEPLLADLSSMAAVRGLARDIEKATDRLDVLINNAGIAVGDRLETADGYEATFAVNHLAPFLLTTTLLPLLEASAPSRVITVSSMMHAQVKALPIAELADPPRYNWSAAYARSKLCNVLFTRALARRLAGTGVTANCLHPGVISTDLGGDGDMSGLLGAFFGIFKVFLPGPTKGARTSIHLATAPDVAETTGAYFARCKPARTSRLAQDDTLAEALWAESEARIAAALDDG